ncbi:MAG: TRAP transporter large permease, partial [Candidatus Adiutrix sp.]|jgi:C4-dicarboxylate transporter DctM subunit|nr:TRAP transporter large permease [Candidatus Adiutrix sp.]
VAVSILTCAKFEKRSVERLPFAVIAKAFVDAIAALMMPVIILGGIYGKFCTPTEAAALACVYAFGISCLVYQELPFKDLPKIFIKSSISTAIVLLTVAMAAPFSWLMTSAGIPPKIMSTVLELFQNKYVIFLMMNATLLFLGCFLETQSIILLMTPILLPIAKQFGLDPIALGLIIVINTSIGMITPPMAVNLYVAANVSGATVESISKRILPYLFSLMAVLLLFTYLPDILTFLPDLVKGK